MGSCQSDYEMLKDAKKKFPHLVISPVTSFLANRGCNVMGTDTITGNVYCIIYRTGSNTSVSTIQKVN